MRWLCPAPPQTETSFSRLRLSHRYGLVPPGVLGFTEHGEYIVNLLSLQAQTSKGESTVE